MPLQKRREPLVPKAPPALLAWLWPERYPKPQDEEKAPEMSARSDNSVLSTDSYLAELKPIDDKFRRLCQDILILDTGKNILQDRKILSHDIKKRERAPILFPWRRKWTTDMDRDYSIYKAKVDHGIPLARKQAAKAKRLVEESTRRREDMAVQEMKLCHALDYHQVWFDAAIDAAKARIEFMHKYCPQGCFTPKGDRGHLIAAESNLNSAKKAVRELEQERGELGKLRTRMDQEARHWGSAYAPVSPKYQHQHHQPIHVVPSSSWHGNGSGGQPTWVYRGSQTN
ncbi:hypothetical protein V8F06_008078 [Rhypophila decipiens]